ncbi:MAG: hypothetical protein GWN32_07885, partial [Gemmatimonadetes bacterium]|nr:hypothetical protein [Actinomycetota bacterium]NIW36447.1 hypothetical protein [Gemmatimonadota bacterium]
MIRPLRVRHRTMITLLAVGVPLVFVAGLSVRRPVPVAEPLTFAGAPATDPSDERLLLRTDPGAGLALDVVLLDVDDAGAT